MTRLLLKIFGNLIVNSQCVSLMIDNETIPFLEIESRKNFKTGDLKNQILEIINTLNQNYKVYSNFEKYKKELETEKLKWGPCHTEQFWKENVYRFEEDKFTHIKHLFELVQHATDPMTIAVALFDLGEFARNYPNSKIFFDKKNRRLAFWRYYIYREREWVVVWKSVLKYRLNVEAI